MWRNGVGDAVYRFLLFVAGGGVCVFFGCFGYNVIFFRIRIIFRFVLSLV